MSEFEIILRSVGYAIAAIALLAAAGWYGWELRERLAIKLEYFRITNDRWHRYDDDLKRNNGKPLRGEIHEIRERQSDK